ncbi:MAG: FKBP-type peptidyl-prolyl cis-trans isomerase [Rikenellaceae bacterium]
MISKIKTAILLLVAVSAVACGGSNSSKSKRLEAPTAVLTSESDSLAYIIGMSVAQNLLKMDSLIDLNVVGAAIAHSGSGKLLFTPEDARSSYLKYKLYIEPERRRAYEEEYLMELSLKDRDYTRSKSGMIYNIKVIGDQNLISRNNGDWVELHYTISRLESGEELFTTHSGEDIPLMGGLSTLPSGLQECVKLIGKGGKVTALLPSKLAYGEVGDETLGIAPYETLRYDVEVVNVERNGANRREAINKRKANSVSK